MLRLAWPGEVYGDLFGNGIENSLVHVVVPSFSYGLRSFAIEFASIIAKDANFVNVLLQKLAKTVKSSRKTAKNVQK